MSTTSETWAPVVGYEGQYEVSDHGRVRSLDRWIIDSKGHRYLKHGRLLQPQTPPNRYPTLIIGREEVRRYVHDLVLEAFAGPRPAGMQVLHGNDVKTDNHLTNLRWGTPADNAQDAQRNGRNFHRRKTHCPRGHALVTPNLRSNTASQGNRGCLACNRAYSVTRAHGRTPERLQEASDRIYAEIMGAAS